jgi:hypothetical protein
MTSLITDEMRAAAKAATCEWSEAKGFAAGVEAALTAAEPHFPFKNHPSLTAIRALRPPAAPPHSCEWKPEPAVATTEEQATKMIAAGLKRPHPPVPLRVDLTGVHPSYRK